MYRDNHAVKQFENDVFAVMKGQGAAHEEGHSRRVAHYSAEYIKSDGGNVHGQKKAYLTGIGHDVIRPPSDEPHELPSAEKFIELVAPYQSALELTDTDVIEMYDAIASHSDLPKHWGVNQIGDAVVFADKVFEASGAYIAFRRADFMGEKKGKTGDAVKETLKKTEEKTAKFSPNVFPLRVRKIAEHQYDWQIKLLNGLQSREPWAVNLAKVMYMHGVDKDTSLEDAIRDYVPVSDIDAKFKQEAVDYLDGKLAKLFKNV